MTANGFTGKLNKNPVLSLIELAYLLIHGGDLDKYPHLKHEALWAIRELTGDTDLGTQHEEG